MEDKRKQVPLYALKTLQKFAYAVANVCFLTFISGCTVAETSGGRTYLEFSWMWFFIILFTGPIGITIDVIYVICCLSGCS